RLAAVLKSRHGISVVRRNSEGGDTYEPERTLDREREPAATRRVLHEAFRQTELGRGRLCRLADRKRRGDHRTARSGQGKERDARWIDQEHPDDGREGPVREVQDGRSDCRERALSDGRRPGPRRRDRHVRRSRQQLLPADEPHGNADRGRPVLDRVGGPPDLGLKAQPALSISATRSLTIFVTSPYGRGLPAGNWSVPLLCTYGFSSAACASMNSRLVP